MKKRFIATLGAIVLALTTVLGLSGCGKATPDNLSNVKPLEKYDAACPWAAQLDNPPTLQDGGNLPNVDNGEVALIPSESARMCAAARARYGKLTILSDKQVAKLGLKPVVDTDKDLGGVYPFYTTFAPLYVSVSKKVKKECVLPLLVLDYQGNYVPVSPNAEIEKRPHMQPYYFIDQVASTLNNAYFDGKC